MRLSAYAIGDRVSIFVKTARGYAWQIGKVAKIHRNVTLPSGIEIRVVLDSAPGVERRVTVPENIKKVS